MAQPFHAASSRTSAYAPACPSLVAAAIDGPQKRVFHGATTTIYPAADKNVDVSVGRRGHARRVLAHVLDRERQLISNLPQQLRLCGSVCRGEMSDETGKNAALARARAAARDGGAVRQGVTTEGRIGDGAACTMLVGRDAGELSPLSL